MMACSVTSGCEMKTWMAGTSPAMTATNKKAG